MQGGLGLLLLSCSGMISRHQHSPQLGHSGLRAELINSRCWPHHPIPAGGVLNLVVLIIIGRGDESVTPLHLGRVDREAVDQHFP
jgi:hypothetical protein